MEKIREREILGRTLKKKKSFSKSPIKLSLKMKNQNNENDTEFDGELMKIEEMTIPEDKCFHSIFKWLEDENVQWVSPLEKKDFFFVKRRESIFQQVYNKEASNSLLNNRRSSFSLDNSELLSRRSRNSIQINSVDYKVSDPIGIQKFISENKHLNIQEKSGGSFSDDSDFSES